MCCFYMNRNTGVWLVQYKIPLWFSLHACAVDMQDEERAVAMCILRPALSLETLQILKLDQDQ